MAVGKFYTETPKAVTAQNKAKMRGKHKMIDEEIEIKLQRAAENGVGFNAEVLDYINRLKAENEQLKDLSLIVKAHKYCVTPKHCQNQGEIRKETAKEIFKDICDEIFFDEDCGESIRKLKRKYGIEVDEQ